MKFDQAINFDQGAYDASPLDAVSLRQLARDVARETRATPVTHQRVEWRNGGAAPVGPATEGWIVETEIEERQSDFQAHYRRPSTWEAGWLIFLTKSGELLIGEFHRELRHSAINAANFDLTHLQDSRLTCLDRRNVNDNPIEVERGRYYYKGLFRLVVPRKGDGLRDYLNQLRVRTAGDRLPHPPRSTYWKSPEWRGLRIRLCVVACGTLMTLGILWLASKMSFPTISSHEDVQTFMPDFPSLYSASVFSSIISILGTVLVDRFYRGSNSWFFIGFVVGVALFLFCLPWSRLDNYGGLMFSVGSWWWAPIAALVGYAASAILPAMREKNG
ncbi:hypothetical protein [Rhodococcus ruber]|uniref:hypothetical protein n=1 Tax=Rhodococcus ruber TaxID=1830 RepID=UPI0011AB4BEF|nr:hypothetical protein [Rhodococcus ruber]